MLGQDEQLDLSWAPAEYVMTIVSVAAWRIQWMIGWRMMANSVGRGCLYAANGM